MFGRNTIKIRMLEADLNRLKSSMVNFTVLLKRVNELEKEINDIKKQIEELKCLETKQFIENQPKWKDNAIDRAKVTRTFEPEEIFFPDEDYKER